MWFKTASRIVTTAVTSLRFDELMAQKPLRWPSSLPSGVRGPVGERGGRGRAHSLDFDGISPYQPGDDPRSVDWRATLRTGQMQIKRFAAQSHRARMIVLELRADLFFGTQHQLMAKTAALLAARVILEALMLNEPVGLACGAARPIHPKRGRSHALMLIGVIQHEYQRVSESRQSTSAPYSMPAHQLGLASATLQRGDELCLIDDIGELDPEFEIRSRELAESRALVCYLVRDSIHTGHIQAGRYPARTAVESNARVWRVRHKDLDKARLAIQSQQRDRIQWLTSLGWQVELSDRVLSVAPSLRQAS